MARDWRFAPASFNGAPFYVKSAGPSGGRRKVVHEYPGSEYWDVEDLGTKAKKVTLTAYFVSETADIDYAAFVAACDQPLPGELSLPFFGVVAASAESWEPTWSPQDTGLNYVGAQCSFVIENPAGAPVALGLGARLMAALLVTASATIGAAITGLFAGLPATSYQIADGAAYLADQTAFVETVLQGTIVPDKTAAAAALALATLAPTASPAAETDPGAFVASALGILDQITIDATADDAAPAYQTAAALAVSMIPASVTGAPSAAQAAAAIPVATAVAATMQAIRLTATATYVDRPTASAARATIQGLAVAVLPFVGALGADVTSAFSDLWGQAVTALTRVILNLAPVLLFQSNVSLPSTVLAYRLYADPARGVDLVQRNQVATPLLMPTLFEAAAPS